MKSFVVLSGCSGGGKSSLLQALKQRGFAVVEEPGRRIVAEERKGNGSALPWVDMSAFARRAIAMALDDFDRAHGENGLVFFDRGLIDAVAALAHTTGQNAYRTVLRRYRYSPIVFMAPPWSEIYGTDADRRHGLSDAVAEYERLTVFYTQLGYRLVELPKIALEARADFVLATLGVKVGY